MTLGEKRVNLDFNPSGDSTVHALKATMASFIDQVEALKEARKNREDSFPGETGEFMRIAATAQTYAETASMWAVKAATRP
jgi:hypothetical protein